MKILETKEGCCRFCGQMKLVSVDSDDVQQEKIDEEATLQCECDDAVKYRGKRATERGVKQLLGENAVENGFRYALPDDSIQLIRRICGHMLDGMLDCVSFTDEQGDKIRLKVDGNAVKIKRSYKREAEV